MHILVVSDEIFPDAIGGVGKSLYNECVALVHRGHQITVLVRALNPTLPKVTDLDGFRIIRFFGPPRSSKLYYLYPFAIPFQVMRHLRRLPNDFDLIYMHNSLYEIPVWLLGIKKPVICTFYSAVDAYIQSNIERGKYGRLAPFAVVGAWLLGRIESWAFSRINLVFPRSQSVLRELHQHYPKAPVPKYLIPLGININLYKPHPQPDARQKLGLPQNRPIFITVRRLEGRMGLTNLIDAMRQVCQHEPQALLLIAGKGYLRDQLEERIRSYGLEHNVRLLGFVSEAELPLYLSASDLFVLPTESLEGFGLATIEALASGLPVAGTPAGATPEILEPISPNLVMRDTSAAAISERLIYWLEHYNQLSPLGVRCRAYAQDNFDAENIAAQLETLFEDVIRQAEVSRETAH
jgi:glycosyltransferase involved in cell wall biosynthesis